MAGLEGKVALVTGAARGIGRAIAERLAREGADLALCDLNTDWLAETAEAVRALGRNVSCFAVDVADSGAVNQAVADVVKTCGRVDVLVNNAGITKDALMLRMTEEDWDAVLETNLKSVFNFCKAAYRPMMKQRSGRIINLSSVVGVMGNPGQTNYAASKAGIIGFSKSLAKELGARGVTVNVVAPGYVATDMTAAISDKAKEAMLGAVPLGRPASPEEIASAVLFLAAPTGAYITGHVLHVDGGLAM